MSAPEPEQLDLLDWLAAQPPCPPQSAAAVEAVEAVSPATSAGPVHLTRVDPSCNMRRFYSLALTTSLFGECGVERHWGRIGTSGQSRTEWYGQAPEADAALQALLRAKRKKGYRS